MARILVIEDEPQMRDGLKLNFEYEGHEVELAADGKQGLAAALEGNADLILLDIMLPGMDGMEVLRQLRSKGNRTPVVMLTARGLESDKVRGLKVGADDYVTKPFSVRELSARIEAVLRRARETSSLEREASDAGEEAGGETMPPFESFAFADVEIDFTARTVTKAGEPVTLSYKEFELLSLLVHKQRHIVSRSELLEKVWGFNRKAQPATRTIDAHVANLRKKLGDAGERGRYIRTVHKIGYRFVPEG